MNKHVLDQELNGLAGITNKVDYASAYAEWLNSRVVEAANFQDVITEVFGFEGESGNPYPMHDEVRAYVSNCLASHQIDENALLAFPDGFMTAKDFCTALTEGISDYVYEFSNDWETRTVSVMDPETGNVSSITIGELIDNFKTGIQSSLIEVSALKAMLSTDITERLTVFKSRIESFGANVSAKYNSLINYWNHVLSNTMATRDQLIDSFGTLTKLTDDSQSNSQTISEQYTGTSSRYIYSWNLNFKGFLSGVAYVMFKLPFDIGKWLRQGVNIGCEWIHNKISNLFNPLDVRLTNNSNPVPSFDDFSYSFDFSVTLGRLNLTALWAICQQGEDPYSLVANDLPAIGSVYSFPTMIGEIIMKVIAIHDPHVLPEDISITMRVNYKPYPISESAFATICQILNTGSWATTSVLVTMDNDSASSNYIGKILSNLFLFTNTNTNFLYVPDEDSRNFDLHMWQGISRSVSLFIHICGMLNEQLKMTSTSFSKSNAVIYLKDNVGHQYIANLGQIVAGVTTIPEMVNKPFTPEYTNIYDPTNIDMLRMISGYNSYQNVDYFDIPQYISQFVPNEQADTGTRADIAKGLLIGSFMVLLSQILVSRAVNTYYKGGHLDALQYSGFFLPYFKDLYSFKKGKYYVPTDAERDKIYSNNMNVIITVLVVAAVSITTAVVASRIVRRVRINRIQAQGELDNAMWNGRKLTSNEARKYFRLARKNGAINSYTSDLLGTSVESIKQGLTQDSNPSFMATIYQIITGQELQS